MLNTLFLPSLSSLSTSKKSSDFSPVCGHRKHTRAVHTHPPWGMPSALHVYKHQLLASGA